MLIEPLEIRALLNTYFVSPSGNDAGAGTSADPWLTLQFAAYNAFPGDTITVRAGNYAGFHLGWYWPQNGTAKAPIVFKAEPGAVITSRNVMTPDAINLESTSYVVIDGFTITNDGSITRAGIRSITNHHVTLRNNTITGMNFWGILSSYSHYSLIENNRISNTAVEHGIYSNGGDYPVIRGNQIWGNRRNGIHFNSDYYPDDNNVVIGALVENNIIHDNGAGGGSAINCDGVQDSTIRNNLLYNNRASGISLYRIDAAAPSINNIVVNNTILMAPTARWALNIQDESTGNKAYNNILYNPNPARGSINISSDSLPAFLSDHNAVADLFTPDNEGRFLSLAEWQTEFGQDAHSLIATPDQLFVNAAANNYHLLDTGPAVDAGTALLAPPLDLDGNARPAGNACDIGVYEFGALPPIPLPPQAPSALAAAALGPTVIKLTWTDNSDNETAFVIEKEVTAGSWMQVATTPAGETSYHDRGLAPASQHTYLVRAANATGSSAFSATATAITQDLGTGPFTIWDTSTAPVVDDSGGTPIEVGVKFRTDVDGFIRGIRFYKDEDSTATHDAHLWSAGGQLLATATFTAETESGWQQVVFTSPVAVSAHTTFVASYFSADGHAPQDLAYFFEGTAGAGPVHALAEGVDGSNGVYFQGDDVGFPTSSIAATNYWVDVLFTTASLVTPPAAPSDLVASPLRWNRIALSWKDNSSNEMGFLIERQTGAGAFTELATVGVGSTTYEDIGLSGSTQYTYRVRAINDAGGSGYSNSATATTPVTPPPPQTPWGLFTNVLSADAIDLFWQGSPTGTFHHYNIYRSTSPGFTPTPDDFINSSETPEFTNIYTNASTTYYYQVRAATIDDIESASSNEATATTPPTVPADLTAIAMGTTGIYLYWTDRDTTNLDHYNIYR